MVNLLRRVEKLERDLAPPEPEVPKDRRYIIFKDAEGNAITPTAADVADVETVEAAIARGVAEVQSYTLGDYKLLCLVSWNDAPADAADGGLKFRAALTPEENDLVLTAWFMAYPGAATVNEVLIPGERGNAE